MKKHGKKYVDAAKKAPQGAVSVAEAVAFVKANAFAKFDESSSSACAWAATPASPTR